MNMQMMIYSKEIYCIQGIFLLLKTKQHKGKIGDLLYNSNKDCYEICKKEFHEKDEIFNQELILPWVVTFEPKDSVIYEGDHIYTFISNDSGYGIFEVLENVGDELIFMDYTHRRRKVLISDCILVTPLVLPNQFSKKVLTAITELKLSHEDQVLINSDIKDNDESKYPNIYKQI